MGYEAMNWVERLDIPTTPKFVLYYLARRAEKDGTKSFPGLAKIMKATGLTRRTVQVNIRWLEHVSLIEQTDGGRGGRGHRSTYRLCVEKGASDDIRGEVKGRISQQERAHLTTGKGASDDTKGASDDIAIRKGRTKKNHRRTVEGDDATTTVKNRQWETPVWFAPMTALDGYTEQNHTKSAESVYTYCVEVADVDPAELVNRFCNEWPWLRVKFGRKDPVAMLRNTVELQASKLIREGHGQPERQTSGRADGWNIPSDGRQPEGHQGRETSGRAAGWDNNPDRA